RPRRFAVWHGLGRKATEVVLVRDCRHAPGAGTIFHKRLTPRTSSRGRQPGMAKLSPEQMKLFADKNFVAVGTVGKDGTPRNTIVWVDVDGDDILINGAQSRGWLKNLKRNPNVALTIFDTERPYRRVSVIGKAVDITTSGGE